MTTRATGRTIFNLAAAVIAGILSGLICLSLIVKTRKATSRLDQGVSLGSHKGGIDALAAVPGSRLLLSGGEDGRLRMWDPERACLVKIVCHCPARILSMAVDGRGRQAACASRDNVIRIYDLTSGLLQTSLTGHTDSVRAMIFLPNGKTLATASWDGTVRLWNLDTGTAEALWDHQGLPVHQLSIASDGNLAIFAVGDGSIAVMDIKEKKLRWLIKGDGSICYALTFLPGDYLAVAGFQNGRLRILNAEGGEWVRDLVRESCAVIGVAAKSQGDRFASTDGCARVTLWDGTTFQKSWEIAGHDASGRALTFTDDGSYLAWGTSGVSIEDKRVDGVITVWKLQ